MTDIKLGDNVIDEVTRYKGIVVGIMNFLNGCARIGIQGKDRTEDGLPVDVYWVDEITVKLTKTKKKKIKTEQKETGGASVSCGRNEIPNIKNSKKQ